MLTLMVILSFLGYLNEAGTLNLARFEAYMRKLGSFDIKQFRDIYDDMKYLKSKTGRKGMNNLTVSVFFTRCWLMK